MRIVYLLTIGYIISLICCSVLSSGNKHLNPEQKIELMKKGVLFELELLSNSELSGRDTLELRYSVKNKTSHDIVILDIHIPERRDWNALKINDNLEIEIDLGGNLLAQMGMIRKFMILKSDHEFTTIFTLPVSEYLSKYNKWKEKKGYNWRFPFMKDVPIIVSVAFSDSQKFFNGELKKTTEFSDYWGLLEGWGGSGIESIVEMFKICGITLKIYIADQ